MGSAAFEDNIEIVKLCKDWGAVDFDETMWCAAIKDNIEIVKLCKDCGAVNFDGAMCEAALRGHTEIVKLCKEYGAINFGGAMRFAASGGHVEIVKLCRGWLGYDSIHHDLLRHLHKRKFFKKIHDGVLPIAWHPDRFFDWCIDEEDKEFLEEVWKEV